MDVYQVARCLCVISVWLLGCEGGVKSASEAPSPGRETPSRGDSGGAEDVITQLDERVVVPGQSIGQVEIGMTMAQMTTLLGQPDSQIGFQRVITVRYLDEGVEVVLTSSEPAVATDNARVRSVGTLPTAALHGELVRGVSRAELEAAFGPSTMQNRGIFYFPEHGLAVEIDQNDLAVRYSVWPPYELDLKPPEMLWASTEITSPRVGSEPGMSPRFQHGGDSYSVVDMHLHVGTNEAQVPTGVEYLLSQLPAMTLMHFPAVSGLVLDPYAEHVGIQEHLTASGVAHGVLLATYTHKTIGFAENELLESLLADSRNVNADGSQWAWGMASINLDDFDSPEVMESRLAALDSYFEKRPDLFIGIKLAHAHQAVGFDDPLYLGVYDVAAKHGVPVLLHTGVSPFPNTQTEPHYYDPAILEAVITAYDGEHGQGYVDFVLGHAGQGDARAIESSLQLAETKTNVWLEISAINRPLLIDDDGNPVESNEPMHPYVLGEIKERNLIAKTLFGTDGPQYFGKVQSYLSLMVSTMKSVGYTSQEIQAVLAENFFNCYAPSGR